MLLGTGLFRCVRGAGHDASDVRLNIQGDERLCALVTLYMDYPKPLVIGCLSTNSGNIDIIPYWWTDLLNRWLKLCSNVGHGSGVQNYRLGVFTALRIARP